MATLGSPSGVPWASRERELTYITGISDINEKQVVLTVSEASGSTKIQKEHKEVTKFLENNKTPSCEYRYRKFLPEQKHLNVTSNVYFIPFVRIDLWRLAHNHSSQKHLPSSGDHYKLSPAFCSVTEYV